jgi:hypothetical protein
VAPARRRAAISGGSGMYPAFYWACVVTLVAWTAFSAYSALAGL